MGRDLRGRNGLTIADRRLVEATLEELGRLGVTVGTDVGTGRARFFSSSKIAPATAKHLIETHGDLIEAYLIDARPKVLPRMPKRVLDAYADLIETLIKEGQGQ